MPDPSPARPNILWISFEDTSPRFGCYGDPLGASPNVDRFASEGRVYEKAFAAAGVCAPSRSAIITGVYPTWSGAHHMRTGHRNRATPEMPTPYETLVPPHVKLLPEYFRMAGYYATNNVKTDYQFKPPFTAWDDGSETAHWRNRPSENTPFFAVFNLGLTHESGMWPEKTPESRFNPDDVPVPPWLPDTPRVRQSIARQYENIARNDERFGQLLAELEEDGLADNTIVVLWSDHGEGLPRAKRWPYDSGIRIPLIVRWPGQVEAGSRSDQLVSLIDLAPSMLSIAGIDAPAHLQGQPFLGPDARARQYVFATRDRYDESYDLVRAVRDGRYKYLKHGYPNTPYFPWIPYRNRHPAFADLYQLHAEGKLTPEQARIMGNRPAEEFYDTESDPHELRNLAGDPDHGEILQRLRGALDAWQRDCDRYGDVPEEQMVRQWYPEGTTPDTAPPILLPIHGDSIAQEPVVEGGTFPDPCLIQLHTPTQGASIGYTFEQGENPSWRVYNAPIRLPRGESVLRAKAHRIGFRPSVERQAAFRIE